MREKSKAGPLASAPASFGLSLMQEAGSVHPRPASPSAQGKSAQDSPQNLGPSAWEGRGVAWGGLGAKG